MMVLSKLQHRTRLFRLFSLTQVVYQSTGGNNTDATFNPLTLPSGGLSGLLSNGASFPDDVNINWRDEAGTTNKILTQYASNFEVKALEQDGATVGRLSGIDIGTDGKIVAS